MSTVPEFKLKTTPKTKQTNKNNIQKELSKAKHKNPKQSNIKRTKSMNRHFMDGKEHKMLHAMGH